MAPRRAGPSDAVVATVVGAVVGAWVVGGVLGGMALFEAWRNTPTGGKAGGLLLGVVLLTAVALGRWLLARRPLPEPGSTSLAGVLLGLIVVLAGIDYAYERWMVVATVVLGALTFLASQQVVVRLGGGSDEEPTSRPADEAVRSDAP